MGRNKYSQHEIDIIGMLLKKKCSGTRFQQKEIRHQLRVNFEFNISDFGEQGKAFGYEQLQEAIRRGAIKILDDATIADMKAKRERDKQKDLEAKKAQNEEMGIVEEDWQETLKQWNEYYNNKE
ncbi:MAG: hypothetical protein K6E54_10910 [Bacteroidaceae bacterium]|nr:hypothetical protein [Bacteroidaceae bacterium]